MKKIIVLLAIVFIFANITFAEFITMEDVEIVEGYEVKVHLERIHAPDELSFDSRGNLYISQDEVTGQIYKLSTNGNLSFIGPSLLDPDSVAINSLNYVFIGSDHDGLHRISPDGTSIKFATNLMRNIVSVVNDKVGIFGESDALYVASRLSTRAGNIVKVSQNGQCELFVNNEDYVRDIAFDNDKYMYFIIDRNTNIYRVNSNGDISFFITIPSTIVRAISFNKSDNFLYVGGNNELFQISLDGNINIFAKNIRPRGLTFNSKGVLYVSDHSDNPYDRNYPSRILRIAKNIENECVDSDGDGVIDPWDHCPGTPLNSYVNSNGCPLISNSALSGQILMKGQPLTEGNATLFQSGELFQKSPIDNNGWYKFEKVSEEKSINIMIRKPVE